MLAMLNHRFDELVARRRTLSDKLSKLYSSDEFASTEERDRIAFETRNEIPSLKMQLWETSRRLDVIREAMFSGSRGGIDAAIECLERRDGDALSILELGLVENPSRGEMMKFLAQAIATEECRSILALIFSSRTENYKSDIPESENRRRGDGTVLSRRSRTD